LTDFGLASWPRNPGSGKLQKHKDLKKNSDPFGTKRKVVRKGQFSLVDFLPEVRK
jgi:hypothetical protein